MNESGNSTINNVISFFALLVSIASLILAIYSGNEANKRLELANQIANEANEKLDIANQIASEANGIILKNNLPYFYTEVLRDGTSSTTFITVKYKGDYVRDFDSFHETFISIYIRNQNKTLYLPISDEFSHVKFTGDSVCTIGIDLDYFSQDVCERLENYIRKYDVFIYVSYFIIIDYTSFDEERTSVFYRIYDNGFLQNTSRPSLLDSYFTNIIRDPNNLTYQILAEKIEDFIDRNIDNAE